MRKRQTNNEGGAAAFSGIYADAAAMDLDDLFGDEEAQSQSATRGAITTRDLIEAREEVPHVSCGHSSAVVLHPNLGLTLLTVEVDLYALGVGCIGDGIDKQIEYDLLEAVRISLDDERGLMVVEDDGLASSHHLSQRDGLHEQLIEAHRMQIQGQLATLQAAGVEQIIHQSRETLHLSESRLGVAAYEGIRRLIGDLLEQQL